MSIEKLKEQARRHEQKEEWLKALDQYKKAIEKLAKEDQPDIGLYNRVGDLFVRVGNLAAAVEHYEQAVDLYMEAELPNNAIAVCKKVIRNVPDRYQIYLKMGQIRAQQGFMPDARTNYLTFAERAAQAGESDESLEAMVAFTDMAPDDVEMRLFVAEQLIVQERVDEAVAQLTGAYQRLSLSGDAEQAATVEARIREIAPDADLTAEPASAASFAGSGVDDDGEVFAEFGEIQIGGEDDESEAAEAAASAIEEAVSDAPSPSEAPAGGDGGGVAIEDFQIAGFDDDDAGDAGDDDEGGAVDLPIMTFDAEEEENDSESTDLPTVAFETEDDDDAEAVELPIVGFEEEEDDDDAEAVELPIVGFEEEEDDDDAGAVELPIVGFDEEEESDEPAEAAAPVSELDAAAFGVSDHGDRETKEYVDGPEEMGEIDVGLDLPGADEASDDVQATADGAPEAMEAAVDDAADGAPEAMEAAVEDAVGDDVDLAPEELRARIAESPDDVSLHQRLVEVSYSSGSPDEQASAYLGLAEALTRGGQTARAAAAYQQVLAIDPANEAAKAGLGKAGAAPARPVKEVAATEEYVDLGSLLLGDDDEKSTRFVVAYEEPSGDEDADFAKMLAQFKNKVSENLDADDVRAHHDLGTAYKEMGLLDEAIAEYQQALRASSAHLPTYELMGQTFMEMGKPEQAVRSLERALKVDFEVEDELVGIYYYLARAYEEVDQKDKAVEFYDRVFSLDINFADVTERLRALR